MKITDWLSCYDDNWNGSIHPLAYAHPAKYSRGLIRRIYSHLLALDWIRPGDTVLDCFGGVGLGALDAITNGLHWIGCELEQKFVDLGQGCDCTGISKADWVRFYGRWDRANYKSDSPTDKDGRHWCPDCLEAAKRIDETPGQQLGLFGPLDPVASYKRNSGRIPYTRPHHFSGNIELFQRRPEAKGKAVLLQGDSRKLTEVIRQAGGLVSQPNDGGKIGGLVYFLLFDSDNSIAALVEVGIPVSIFDLLGLYGVPVFSINLDNGIEFRQKEVDEISSDSVLPDINNSLVIEKFREGDFELALPRFAITTDRAINPAPVFQAIRLSRETLFTHRALLFDASFSKGVKTLDGAKFSITPVDSGDLSEELFTALEANLINLFTGSDSNTLNRTILCPLFGLLGSDLEGFTANLAGDEESVIPELTSAFLGTKFTVTLVNSPNKYLERLIAIFADSIDFSDHQLTTPPVSSIISQNKRSVNAIISSPPYADALSERGGRQRAIMRNDPTKAGFNDKCRDGIGYGTTPGQLASLPEGKPVVVASPPYVEAQTGGDAIYDKLEERYRRRLTERSRTAGYRADLQGHTPGQLASLPEGKPVVVASPPYAGQEIPASVLQSGGRQGVRSSYKAAGAETTRDKYGTTPGQLGAMPEGSAVVSSPPFAGNTGGRGEASRNGIDPALFDRHQGAMVGGIGSEGNLAGMKPGALVTSPPYESSIQRTGDNPERVAERMAKNGHDRRTITKAASQFSNDVQAGYNNENPANIGNESGETFWSAARLIISQCYQLLPPGAPAVWVLKSFVRDGAIVDFPGQWQQLCEACGFETVEIIHAWLVKDKGTQVSLEGEQVRKTVKRSSFFRRIYERKYPHLSIDFETVLITRRLAQ